MSTIAILCLQVSAIADNCQPTVRNELTIVNPVVVSVWRDKARKSEPYSVAFRAKPIVSLDDYYRPPVNKQRQLGTRCQKLQDPIDNDWVAIVGRAKSATKIGHRVPRERHQQDRRGLRFSRQTLTTNGIL